MIHTFIITKTSKDSVPLAACEGRKREGMMGLKGREKKRERKETINSQRKTVNEKQGVVGR